MKALSILVLVTQLIAGTVIVQQYNEIQKLKTWQAHAQPLLTWKQQHGIAVLMSENK
jgi:hypothetical protein